MYVCVSVWKYVHVSAGPVETREGIRYPRTGVLGGYELPVVDVEIQTQFL